MHKGLNKLIIRKSVNMDDTAQHETSDDSSLSKIREANWPNVLFFIHIHLLSLYGIWLLLFEVKILTIVLLVSLIMVAILGMTTGAHRLWAHRSYEASTGLRVALMLFQTLAGIGPIYDWVQHHRLHHAHFQTPDDPYDNTKGFLYSHFWSRLRKLSPHQEKLLNSIDMSDLEKDSIVMIQKKIYWLLYGVLFALLPLNAPLEYWDDTVLSSVFVIGFLRYLIVVHASLLIESSVSVWGLKPGEKSPPDSNSVFLINKTFWPYYHYLVPYDYKSGEYGTYDCGCSSAFIRVWAALGLAKKLRTVETSTIQRALAALAKSNTDFQTCLNAAILGQDLPDEHYLHRE